LDAFSCPSIKKSHHKTSKDLLETQSILADVRSTCQTLEQQLVDKDDFYTHRESELQELHRCELTKVESCLTDLQRNSEDKIAFLEAELRRKDEEASEKLRAYVELSEARQREQEQQILAAKEREADLLRRIDLLTCTENELREKVHSSELEFSERLQLASLRERELTEKVTQLNGHLDDLQRRADEREKELTDKLNITMDECTVLRHTRSSPEQHNRTSTTLNQSQILQDEVESLRCVLELKQREISDLRKQVQEYERDANELPAALVKISTLESRIEDLQVQLNARIEEEK
jgi:DNA repair exonuclease SbcCD ATPase subunit